jgi:pSer/pThr/pTyr-binding forkhead associated (FHA) protein
MTLMGHVQNGVVVFDHPLQVPDGTLARVDVLTWNPTRRRHRSPDRADSGRGGSSSRPISICSRRISRKHLE